MVLDATWARAPALAPRPPDRSTHPPNPRWRAHPTGPRPPQGGGGAQHYPPPPPHHTAPPFQGAGYDQHALGGPESNLPPLPWRGRCISPASHPPPPRAAHRAHVYRPWRNGAAEQCGLPGKVVRLMYIALQPPHPRHSYPTPPHRGTTPRPQAAFVVAPVWPPPSPPPP